MTEDEKLRVVRDTEPDALKPMLAAIDRLDHVVKRENDTTRAAISSLRSEMLLHYHAVQMRADDHARRIARIEDSLSLPPLPPEDMPRALPDDVAAE